eukprot:CAMPEP_0185746996 /NCGR_PEP_ID=MMETSP1174-20130828/5673_1 /TAXON_ID=35687 /ORGANISM="Dictyocha speculum, Strain CCMP1381" /LENGTH=182 /DNA_ID=CAMNT_0028421997 /DNA_START=45 /DNA_END=593 /DNA_ORIENTATION=-
MGIILTKVLDRLGLGALDRRILLVGLDAAGKTTILYKLKLGETVTTIPTIGFNVETVTYKKCTFTMWDIGGQDRIRPLWRHYYNGTDAVIFVIDSNDRERVEIAAEELHKLMNEDEMKDAVLLCFANKQDLPDSMKAPEMIEKLQLRKLRHDRWYIQPASAVAAEGLYEGLDWMTNELQQQR